MLHLKDSYDQQALQDNPDQQALKDSYDQRARVLEQRKQELLDRAREEHERQAPGKAVAAMSTKKPVPPTTRAHAEGTGTTVQLAEDKGGGNGIASKAWASNASGNVFRVGVVLDLVRLATRALY